MYQLTKKLHDVLNQVKGFEAGYKTETEDVIYVHFEDKVEYEIQLVEVGKMSEYDMSKHFDSLPIEKNASSFRFTNKIVNALEMFKDFGTGYSTRNVEIFMIEFSGVLYEARTKELKDVLETGKEPESSEVLLDELYQFTLIEESRELSENEAKRYVYIVDYCRERDIAIEFGITV